MKTEYFAKNKATTIKKMQMGALYKILPFFLLGIQLSPSAAHAVANEKSNNPYISWEVKSRFPLFESDDALFEILKLQPDTTLLNWASKTLGKNPDILAPLMSDYAYSSKGGCKGRDANYKFKTLWNPCTEKYSSKLFEEPTAHDVIVKIINAPVGSCTFKLGEAPTIAAPCHSPLVISVPYLKEPQKLAIEGIPGSPTLTENIQVRDVLLFAFGDSFSSGESNPDVQAIHTNHPTQLYEGGEGLFGASWIKSPHQLKRSPEWWDRRCHRSVLSWPILAAAQLAANDPHMVVKIASWACTGAEISDGFYSPQIRKGDDAKGKSVSRSQFMAARDAICTKDVNSGESFDTVIHRSRKYGATFGSAVGCSQADRRREIDGILFTFGGNDVYFGPVILDAIGITKTNISFINKPITKLRDMLVKKPKHANDLIEGKVDNKHNHLQTRYKALNAGFLALGVTPDKVFQIQYPDPLRDKNGAFCDVSHFDGMDSIDNIQIRSNVSKWEACNVHRHLIYPLQNAIKPSKNGWNVVDEHVIPMLPNGICAFNSDREKEMTMPRLMYGIWARNYRPTDYNHYEPTQRWFRTPDDVVMGMYSGSTFMPVAGAFHPSAQAHAAIADEVFKRLKRRLTTDSASPSFMNASVGQTQSGAPPPCEELSKIAPTVGK